MKLRQLQQFVQVAETLNFREAAERLHMAQPPLSASVKRFEADLGGALFERSSGSGVRLTPAGAAMLPHARRVLVAMQRCQEAFVGANLGQGGVLRIGFVGSVTYELLPLLIGAVRQEMPNVQLVLRESSTVATLEDIQARRLDAGLIRAPLLAEEPVALDTLVVDEFMLAVSTADPLAGRSAIALSEAADRPFVMGSRSAIPNLHAMCLLLCQRAGFVPRVAQEATQILTMLSLVSSGVGVALMPSSGRHQVTPGVRYVRLSDSPADFVTGISLATLSAEQRTPLQERFRALALRVTRSAPQGAPG